MLYQDTTTLLPYTLFIHGKGAEDEVPKNKEEGVLSRLRGIGSFEVLTWALDPETRVEWS